MQTVTPPDALARSGGRRAALRTERRTLESSPTGTPVKPVANAIRILRYLSQANGPARAVQIARELGVNNSTCFNILRTMAAEGVLEFNPQAKTYAIGLGLVKLIDSTLTDGKRVSASKPLLHEVAERFGVTATLWRRIFPDRIVLVSVEHSRSDLRVHMGEGQRLPMMMGATGRLIAANGELSRPDAQAAFDTLRWARPLSFDAYWRGVKQAEKQGWAVDDGYFSQGILAVAAPVFNRDDKVEFSISAVMFRGQRNEAGVSVLGAELLRYSEQLAKLLF